MWGVVSVVLRLSHTPASATTRRALRFPEAPRVARTCATGEGGTYHRCHHCVAGCRRATDVCPEEARFIIAPFVSFIRGAIGSRVEAAGGRTPPRWSAVDVVSGATAVSSPELEPLAHQGQRGE